jgi:hypothetical protein
MRVAMLGVLVGAALALVAVGATPDGRETLTRQAGACASATPSAELIALSTTVENKYQQVTVIDPKQRAMSVYHVELASGHIELCSVRHIHYDLQMESYDNKGLLPREIRSMLEPR